MTGLSDTLYAAIQAGLSGAPAEAGAARWARQPLRPWLAWTLVALLRQVARQQWMMRVLMDRLPGVRDGQGKVPDPPGWTYEFHGAGCCLTGPHETIDMDFDGLGCRTVDSYFFAHRVLALSAPSFPEVRVRELLPTADSIHEAIQVLVRGKALVAKGHNTFMLTPQLKQLVDVAVAADFDSADARRRWREHLGDFEKLAGHLRAEDARCARREWLLALLGAPATTRVAIEPLELIVSGEEFMQVCSAVIDRTPGWATALAIKRLDAHPELPPCPAIVRLLDRLAPDKHHPAAMVAAAGYLLRRGIERERAVAGLLAFARVEKVAGYGGNPMLGDFALLALEFDLEHALDLVRAALRSSTPIVRLDVTAALCTLNRSWCRREFVRALDAHTKVEDATEILAAINRSGDARALAASGRWLGEHPPAAHQGLGYTWEEVALANAGPWLESAMAERRAWAERVGPSIPEDLDSPA